MDDPEFLIGCLALRQTVNDGPRLTMGQATVRQKIDGPLTLRNRRLHSPSLKSSGGRIQGGIPPERSSA